LAAEHEKKVRRYPLFLVLPYPARTGKVLFLLQFDPIRRIDKLSRFSYLATLSGVDIVRIRRTPPRARVIYI